VAQCPLPCGEPEEWTSLQTEALEQRLRLGLCVGIVRPGYTCPWAVAVSFACEQVVSKVSMDAIGWKMGKRSKTSAP
jgi:hypothetical protein